MFIVADDCNSILRLMKWKLEIAFGKNIGVLLAADGLEVVAIYEKLLHDNQNTSVDAILMDYHMPKLSGVDAIAQIRVLEQQFDVKSPVNIIGFSADISEEMNDLFLNCGANDLISKPPEPGALEELCRNILNKRSELNSNTL